MSSAGDTFVTTEIKGFKERYGSISEKKIFHAASRMFPAFRQILEALRVEWRNSMLRFVSVPEQRNEY